RLAMAATAMSAATIRPARRSGVSSASAKSQMHRMRTTVRQARPNSNLRLKSMLFHAPVQRSAAEPKFACRQRDVEVVHPQRPFDHLLFELVEVEGLAEDRNGRRARPLRKREILDPIGTPFRHDHGALGSMAKRAHIPGPIVPDECVEDLVRQAPRGL